MVDLALAVGGVQRVFDLFRGDAQRRSFVAINVDVHLRIGDQQVAGHILQPGQLGHLLLKGHGIAVQLLRVGSLQRQLVLTLGEFAAHLNRRQILHVGVHTGNGREFHAQFGDHFVNGGAVREHRRNSAQRAAHHWNRAVLFLPRLNRGIGNQRALGPIFQVQEQDPGVA